MPTITNLSNLPAIYDAVYAMAQAVPGLAWAGQWQGLWPDNSAVTGTPNLIVPYPEFGGFSLDGRTKQPADVEGSQLMGMFHEFNIFVISEYDENDENTWRVPMAMMGLIVRQFRGDRTLSDTCYNSRCVNPHLLEYTDRTNAELRFFGCQVTVEAFEQVLTPDT